MEKLVGQEIRCRIIKLDVADEDVVVAGREALPHSAFDGRQHAREYGHAGLAAPPVQSIETVLPLTGEALSKIPLALC